MKKSDIKNGMHVITNDGTEYIVISNVEATQQAFTANTIMLRVDDYGWLSLDRYNDDLYHNMHCEYDIKTVYAPLYYRYVLSSVYKNGCIDKANYTKVWERPIVKKMTKAEIEKELGYEIDIVD